MRSEYLRWLIEESRMSRPVLKWMNGKVIKMREAEDLLGARGLFVFGHPIKIVTCKVEENIQLMLEKLRLPLGIRLHRHVACGVKIHDPSTPFFRVFITLFSKAEPLTWSGNRIDTMTINGHQVKVMH
jgi:hypothetical protein